MLFSILRSGGTCKKKVFIPLISNLIRFGKEFEINDYRVDLNIGFERLMLMTREARYGMLVSD
jgi:hypothetical protein